MIKSQQTKRHSHGVPSAAAKRVLQWLLWQYTEAVKRPKKEERGREYDVPGRILVGLAKPTEEKDALVRSNEGVSDGTVACQTPLAQSYKKVRDPGPQRPQNAEFENLIMEHQPSTDTATAAGYR